MKKVNKLLLIIICLIYPSNIYACPHVDSNGNAHLQIYNSDYSVVTMIYPENGYLYSKETYMKINGVNIEIDENYLISEQFGFPIYQEITDYITYYWFLDDTLLDKELDEIDIDITVENIDNMYVNGDGFSLDVGLTNTYESGIKNFNSLTEQIYYNVNIVDVSDDNSYLNIVKNNNIEVVYSDFLNIYSEFMITSLDGFNYETEYVSIENFYDTIDVEIHDIEYEDDIIVINLDDIYSKYIVPTYTEDGCYKFTISKKGVYVLAKEIVIEQTFVEDLTDTTIINSINKNSNQDYTIFIIVGVSLTIIIGITSVCFLKSKKK